MSIFQVGPLSMVGIIMGCVHSHLALINETPIEAWSIDLYNQSIKTLFDPESALSPAAPAWLQDLKVELNIKITSEAARVKIVLYLEALAADPRHYHLVEIAANIMLKTQQIWHLNIQSLTFLHELCEKDPIIFNALMNQLKELCQQNTLYLQTEHIETVIASLCAQRDLPKDPMLILHQHIEKKNPDITSIIQTLRTQHGPELTQVASKHHLIHHDIPHALEIKERTMHVVCKTLRLLATESKIDCFLRTLASFMIEFHDLVQKDKTFFKSVEIASATFIMEWLIEYLSIDNEPELIKIIEFMADQIIVLGTTMVFSRKQTTDLSQLFFMLEDAAIQAGLNVAPPKASALINIIKTITLITGVCDKSPSSIPTIVSLQYHDESTATLPMIKRHYQQPLLIEKFFNDPSSNPCFDGDPSIAAFIQQEFLITLVPHLCMRAELSIQNKAEEVLTYIDFILSARTARLTEATPAGFKTFFDEKFKEHHMDTVVNTLFFAAIGESMIFSQSQLGGLTFACEKLRLLGFPGKDEDSKPLIDPLSVMKNADMLKGFKSFYDSLDPAEKSALINELLLVIVLQAGIMYAERPELTYIASPASVLTPRKSPVREPHHVLFAANSELFFAPSAAPAPQYLVESSPETFEALCS